LCWKTYAIRMMLQSGALPTWCSQKDEGGQTVMGTFNYSS